MSFLGYEMERQQRTYPYEDHGVRFAPFHHIPRHHDAEQPEEILVFAGLQFEVVAVRRCGHGHRHPLRGEVSDQLFHPRQQRRIRKQILQQGFPFGDQAFRGKLPGLGLGSGLGLGLGLGLEFGGMCMCRSRGVG